VIDYISPHEIPQMLHPWIARAARMLSESTGANRIAEHRFLGKQIRRLSLIGFIDPPGRFRPRKEWQDFLAQMKALPQDDPQVRAAMREAEEVLSLPRNRAD
jgi:hypothetical protein